MLDYDIATLDANEALNTVDIQMWNDREDIYSLVESLEILDMDIVRITVLENVHFAFPVAQNPPAPAVRALPRWIRLRRRIPVPRMGRVSPDNFPGRGKLRSRAN